MYTVYIIHMIYTLYILYFFDIYIYFVYIYHNIYTVIGLLYNVYTHIYTCPGIIHILYTLYNSLIVVHSGLDLVSCLPNVRFGHEQWIESSASWTCRFHRYQRVDASKASSSSTSGTIPLSTIWCSFPTLSNHIPKAGKKNMIIARMLVPSGCQEIGGRSLEGGWSKASGECEVGRLEWRYQDANTGYSE